MLKHHMSKQNQFRNICHKRYYSSIHGGDLLLVIYIRETQRCVVTKRLLIKDSIHLKQTIHIGGDL